HALTVMAAVAAVVILIAALIVQTQQKAEIERQRNRLEAANHRLDQTRRVLVSLLSGAQASGKGPSATLGEVLQDAAHTLSVAPPDDPLTRAGVSEAVGTAMMTLGMVDKARPLLEAALAEFKDLPADSEPRLAVEAELAQLLYYEQKFAEAEPKLRELLRRERARNGGTPSELEGDLLNALGAVLRLQGKLDEAMTAQQEALVLRTKVHGPGSLPVAESHNNIASIHFTAGRYAEAAASFRASLAIRETRLRAGHPMVLATSLNLGTALLRTGDAPGARPLLRSAADGWAAAFGAEHGGIVSARTALGQALRRDGAYDESQNVLESALQWQLARGGPETPAVLATRINIGVTMAENAAGDCARAIESLESIRTHAQFPKVSPGLAAQALRALADACERCGRKADAQRYRDEAQRLTKPN
ncbi:MAG TPA: tetratricopeptide repeat protein, partial [Phycisphaerales bacterium]|nr:tetratricopeptide repeat protein [Phycisphaerales bacterium]